MAIALWRSGAAASTDAAAFKSESANVWRVATANELFAGRRANELIVAAAALDLLIKKPQPELSRPGRRIHHITELPIAEWQLFIHPITPQPRGPGSSGNWDQSEAAAL